MRWHVHFDVAVARLWLVTPWIAVGIPIYRTRFQRKPLWRVRLG